MGAHSICLVFGKPWQNELQVEFEDIGSPINVRFPYMSHTQIESVEPSRLLHEKLSSWLSCSAARCLLELAAACLSTLLTRREFFFSTSETLSCSSTDTEACISSLLDTSVRHSPHFDWVVAHLGSCFPHTVTSRVLSLGLRCVFAS